MTENKNYHQLTRTFQRLSRFSHLSAIAGWDMFARCILRFAFALLAAIDFIASARLERFPAVLAVLFDGMALSLFPALFVCCLTMLYLHRLSACLAILLN